MITGNEKARSHVLDLIKNTTCNILLYGKKGLGKYSFIKEVLLGTDYIEADGKTLDTAALEELLDVLDIIPISGTRFILLDNAEDLSESLSDKLLKSIEEESSNRFIFVSGKPLSGALESRFVKVPFNKLEGYEEDAFLMERNINRNVYKTAMNGCPGNTMRLLNSPELTYALTEIFETLDDTPSPKDIFIAFHALKEKDPDFLFERFKEDTGLILEFLLNFFSIKQKTLQLEITDEFLGKSGYMKLSKSDYFAYIKALGGSYDL